MTASDLIEGLTARKALAGWDHADLILPADEFDGLARKRKTTYRMIDVEMVLDRLRAISERVDTLDGLQRITTDVMRSVLSPHYDKTALLLDVMSGRLPTYRTVEAPRLNDLHADLVLANRIGVANRAIALDVQDAMVQPRPLNNMLSVLWGDERRLDVKESRRLREAGLLRFKETLLWNKTDKRLHPNYLYSARDALRYLRATIGPSGINELDRHLRKHSLAA